MKFSDLSAEFEAALAGTNSFKSLYKEVIKLMNEDRSNAALYLPIVVAARAYVLRFEDQAISADLADRAKAILVGFNKKILEALVADPERRYSLLSEVSAEYELDVKDF